MFQEDNELEVVLVIMEELEPSRAPGEDMPSDRV
jgi:hypothetical protein